MAARFVVTQAPHGTNMLEQMNDVIALPCDMLFRLVDLSSGSMYAGVLLRRHIRHNVESSSEFLKELKSA
jgi:hypothetical protein